MSNKRKDPRRTLKWLGYVVGINGSVIGQCKTEDISNAGARILPAEDVVPPDSFFLVLSKKARVKRRCKVAWRPQTAVGVQFIL